MFTEIPKTRRPVGSRECQHMDVRTVESEDKRDVDTDSRPATSADPTTRASESGKARSRSVSSVQLGTVHVRIPRVYTHDRNMRRFPHDGFRAGTLFTPVANRTHVPPHRRALRDIAMSRRVVALRGSG